MSRKKTAKISPKDVNRYSGPDSYLRAVPDDVLDMIADYDGWRSPEHANESES